MKEKIISKIKKMAFLIGEMVDLVYKGFIENDTHFLNMALNKERIMDDLEKDITGMVVEASKGLTDEERKEYILFDLTAQSMERMGDELRYLMERIEIKIAENLYFSDSGVEQYREVFDVMRRSVSLTVEFLEKEEGGLLEEISENGNKMKALVEKYRKEHLGRVSKGACEPRACNMYFDMLDFTGNVARHCTNIARGYREK